MKPSEQLLETLSEAFELEAEHIAALTLAGQHLDTAAQLDAVVAAEGVMKTGGRYGPALHPAIAEARHQRAAAWAIIKAVIPDDSGSVDAHSLGQAASGAAHRASKAAQARWDRARAAKAAS